MDKNVKNTEYENKAMCYLAKDYCDMFNDILEEYAGKVSSEKLNSIRGMVSQLEYAMDHENGCTYGLKRALVNISNHFMTSNIKHYFVAESESDKKANIGNALLAMEMIKGLMEDIDGLCVGDYISYMCRYLIETYGDMTVLSNGCNYKLHYLISECHDILINDVDYFEEVVAKEDIINKLMYLLPVENDIEGCKKMIQFKEELLNILSFLQDMAYDERDK